MHSGPGGKPVPGYPQDTTHLLSTDMPRSLIGPLILLCLAVSAGCSLMPTRNTDEALEPVEPMVVMDPSIQRWLNLQQQVAKMPIEEIKKELEGTPRPEDN